MNRNMLPLVVVAGVLGLAVLLAPFFMGYKIEADAREVMRQSSQLGTAQFLLMEYRRGFYSSDAVTRLQVPGAGGEPHNLDLHHHIVHGLGLGGFNFGKVTTTLVLDGEASQPLREFFRNEPPLKLITSVGFDGALSGTVYSPPVENGTIKSEKGPGKVSWYGLSGKFQQGKDVGGMDVTMPGLTALSADGTSVAVTGMDMKWDMKRGVESGLMLGDTSMQIGLVEVTEADGESLRIEKMGMDSEAVEDNGQVRLSMSYGMQSLKSNESDVKDFVLALSVWGLDAAAMRMANELNEKMAAAKDDQEKMMLMMQAMQEILPALLSRRPSLVVDKGQLTYNGQQASLGGNIQFVGDLRRGFDPASDFQGELKLDAPRGLVLEMLAKKQGYEAGDAAQARYQAEVALGELLNSGKLVATGDLLSLSLKLGGTGPTLNGLPFNPMVGG